MNEIIISNDFKGDQNNQIIINSNNIHNYDRLNVYMKYQQKRPLNKRNDAINNGQFKTFNKLKPFDIEKNNSINSSLNNNKNILINDKKNFKSMKVLSSINSSKKSRTINDNNVNNGNENDIKINMKMNSVDKYIPKKIKIKNDDIINLLENVDN